MQRQRNMLAWVETAEDYLRSGSLQQLEALLIEQAAALDVLFIVFYRARLALTRSHFEAAATGFYTIASHVQIDAEVYGDLHHRSLVWLAYTHNMLGRYSLAKSLLERIECQIATESHLYAEVLFVYGIIVADHDQGDRMIAQAYLEQARDRAFFFHDHVLEARCCANLAPIYNTLCLFERTGLVIHRVEQINAIGTTNPTQLFQIRNTNLHRLRLMGAIEEALLCATIPEVPPDDGSQHFCGWFTLSASCIYVDADQFDRADMAWQQANHILTGIDDNNLTKAELLWERAWWHLRQQHLSQAQQLIQQAFTLVGPNTDMEHLHAYVIRAVIDLASDDRGIVSRLLLDAAEGFRRAHHIVGLVSSLVHIAGYYLMVGRAYAARKMIAEAFGILRRYRMYGMYYWYPPVMHQLCSIVMREDWGDYGDVLNIRQLLTDDGPVPLDVFGLDSSPQEELAEFATTLAVRRLAKGYWQMFLDLLTDARPIVRIRGARVLVAAHDPEALIVVDRLRNDPDPSVVLWYQNHVERPLLPVLKKQLEVRSFGHFTVLVDNQSWKLSNAGTRKVKAIFGLLLLFGNEGIDRAIVETCLWPRREPVKQRQSFDVAIAAIRRLLKQTNVASSIEYRRDVQHYCLIHHEPPLWWDWSALQLQSTMPHPQRDQAVSMDAKTRFQEPFMANFLRLFEGNKSDEVGWVSLEEQICDAIDHYQALVDQWLQSFEIS